MRVKDEKGGGLSKKDKNFFLLSDNAKRQAHFRWAMLTDQSSKNIMQCLKTIPEQRVVRSDKFV